MIETEDIKYMNRAIEQAELGQGWVNPNPLVGAIIVKNGQIIAEGWHERWGDLHAERNAFKNCNADPKGATMYVTLEPCCHHGKTPPCTEALIEKGIARVVVGMTDPNPLVAGKGVELLRNAGIEVITGIEEEKIRKQNRIFIKYITTGMPWVVMKTAMTLDGKIATHTGDSCWVTGEEARMQVQEMRARYIGIMVGAGTAEIDNPMLTCRLERKARQPIRIVVDSKARIALDSQLVETAKQYRTLVAHTQMADNTKLKQLISKGVELISCSETEGRVNVDDLLKKLGKRGIDAILLEGGGELNETFIRKGFIDEVYAFIAPKIIGGRESKTPVEGQGFSAMKDAVSLRDITVDKVGEDILIHGFIKD